MKALTRLESSALRVEVSAKTFIPHPPSFIPIPYSL
jgi:hypothetical protein